MMCLLFLSNICLEVDYSRSFRILQCLYYLSTLWPPCLESNMALIEIAIDIERSCLPFL
jgi:hypothetical protein